MTAKNTPSPDDYSDIIHLPRPVSKTHPRMDQKSRAAQFAPYAALVGHRDLISAEENLATDLTDPDHTITTEPDPDFLADQELYPDESADA